MTPEERKAFRENKKNKHQQMRRKMKEYMQALPAAERKALRENIKNMSPEERREFMQKEYK